MPYADPARQAEYQREWVAQRRAEWFAGKACAECGISENLQLDHIDPAVKVSHKIWSWSTPRREAELAKCRPLCVPCHKAKSAGEHARGLRNGNTKLDDATVRAIRVQYAVKRGTQRQLAAQYGVNQRTISMIVRRDRRSYVD